jgi:hypothetical protein
MALLAGVCSWALSAAPGVAQPAGQARSTAAGGPETLAQNAPSQTRRSLRVRPKIRVRPRHGYQRYHSLYPLPYDYHYPGPNAVRRCTSRLVAEHRLSGTVLVPRMRCWWAQR